MTCLPSRSRFPHSLSMALVVFLLLSAMSKGAYAQTAITDSSTPSALSPGSPAGTYSLSGFDNLNLFNGHLDFHLPLLGIGGRGAAGYRMMLPVEQKWLVKEYRLPSNMPVRSANPNWWSGLNVGLGPGVMQARYSGTGRYSCEPDADGTPNWRFSYTHTRLTFTGADGTEYELRDQLTGGQPSDRYHTAFCGAGFSRGTVFLSADGSNALFTADAPIIDPVYTDVADPGGVSGYLVMRDGTRYRFDSGLMTWMQDRNGNRITFTYGEPSSFGNQVTAITDSIGRQITIQYNVAYKTYGTGTHITFKGTGEATRDIFLAEGDLGSHLRSGYTARSTHELFPELSGSDNTPPLQVVHSVYLPNDQHYQLFYNPYGEIARVVLPTGGAIEYDYTGGLINGYEDGLANFGTYGGTGSANYQIYRRVVERRTYRNQSDVTPESTMIVSRPESIDSSTGSSIQSLGYVEADQHAGSATGTLLGRTRHYYYGSAADSMKNNPGGFSRWKEGKEYKTEVMAEDGSTVLRRVEQTWQQSASVSWWSWWVAQYPNDLSSEEPPNDPRQVETITTLEPGGANKVSKQTSLNPANGIAAFDQYNNPTDVWEYDYDTGAPGALLRHTHTDYLITNSANGIDYTSQSVHLLSLVRTQQIYSVNGSTEMMMAKSETRYDEAAYAPLGYGVIPGWSDPGTLARGMATTSRRWLNTMNNWVETHAQYDQAGNLRNSWDANGNQSSITYGDTFSDQVVRNTYAFPTHTTSAIPDPNGSLPSRSALENWTTYDYWTGQAVSMTDANNKTTSFEHDDPLDRLTKVNSPDGGWTKYEYSPGNQNPPVNYLRTQISQNSSQTLDKYDYFDGLGRASRSLQYQNSDPNVRWLTADTQYDALGRVWKQSNPYYSSGASSSINPSGNWTTTLYDALGRVKSVTTPDNGVVTSSYSGNTVTVSDQMSRTRESRTDALGRVFRVIEDPGGSGHLNYQTDYTYDVLGNLRQVTQGVQNRYFMYDSLSRLIRAKNPEQAVNTNLPVMTDPVTGWSQWSLAYAYDDNGNLTQKIDPRNLTQGTNSSNVTITYGYDGLNRLKSVDYSDTAAINPDITRYYDGATNGRGRLWQTITSTPTNRNSYTAIDTYDAMGRIRSERQQFYYYNPASQGYLWSASYTVQRSYDLAGHVSTQTYPSNRTVSYAYDLAGRTQSFTGNIGDGVQRSYSSNISYNEWGMQQEQFGTQTAVYNKHFYNVRGQLAEIRESTMPNDTSWNRGAIINHYSGNCWGMCSVNPTAATDDNGNLRKQDHWIPQDEAVSGYDVYSDFYEYDSLNRLQSARETRNGGGVNWQQAYTYDRWGNRTIDQNNTFGEGIPHPVFNVDTLTNRLTLPTGQTGVMQYDEAGNLSNDTYTSYGLRTFDAENRMLTAADNGGGISSYTYDADGRRVRRSSNNSEVWQIYGIDGELVSEYAAGASTSTPQKEYGYRNGELLITASPTSNAPSANLSQGKAATESSNLYGAASLAVDGNTSGNFANNSVTHTNYEANAWWQVDLGSVQSIQSIQLWNRTDCCADRLSNFYVFVSDQPFASTDLQTTINQAGVWNSYTQGAVGVSSIVSVNRTGRYVMVQLAGTNVLSLAEVQVMGAGAAGGPDIEWLVTDQLGTPRMTLDQTGSLVGLKRHDYLPFGEELTAGRTSGQGYTVDAVRQKFTGKERDNETGLDYFGARYYASAQGRFINADPLLASGISFDPQSWNRYAYVLNNPLRLTDPTGLEGEEQEPSQTAQAKDKEKKRPPQRIIYIFIGFDKSEQRTYAVRNGEVTTRGTAPPDFVGLQAQAKKQGVDVRILTGSDVNVENLTKALQDASAYAVIFIGHGATSPSQWHDGTFDSKFPFIPDQGVLTSDGVSNLNGAIDVNAQHVAIFTCESEFASTLFTQGDGNESYIGVYSGATFRTEGLTNSGTLSRMGFAAAQQFVNNQGPDAAVRAANGALKAAPMIGREPLGNPTMDARDYAKRIR